MFPNLPFFRVPPGKETDSKTERGPRPRPPPSSGCAKKKNGRERTEVRESAPPPFFLAVQTLKERDEGGGGGGLSRNNTAFANWKRENTGGANIYRGEGAAEEGFTYSGACCEVREGGNGEIFLSFSSPKERETFRLSYEKVARGMETRPKTPSICTSRNEQSFLFPYSGSYSAERRS